MQMTYSPDGERLFTLGQDACLRVFDVLQLYLPVKALPLSTAHMPHVAMALSPDGMLLCTTTHADNKSFASLLLFSGATRPVAACGSNP